MEIPQRKVVIIGSAYPLRGGLSNFNERLAEEYLKNDWDVELFTFSLQYPSFLFPGKTQLSSEGYSGNISIRVVINSIDPINWIKTGILLRKIAPDLIIIKFWIPFMAPCFGTILRIAKTNGHTKVITIIDNIIPHEKRPGDKILARYFVGAVDGFVAMSRKVLEDISKFNTSKPRVFSAHPIYDNFGAAVSKSQALESLGLDPSYRYILFFGFIRDYKGLDILLNAIANPEIRKMRIRLIVAGEFYTDPKLYVDLIHKNGIDDLVILSNDFIPDSEVYKYFCASDIVVQPYKNATQSGVTQIAYHFNKPMITTNVGGLGEFVPDGVVGYVVDPESAEVSKAILKFYEEGREVEFSENVADLKYKYSWEYFVSNLDSLTRIY